MELSFVNHLLVLFAGAVERDVGQIKGPHLTSATSIKFHQQFVVERKNNHLVN